MTNIDYIQNYFLTHNPHLASDPDRAQILQAMTAFAVIFQKLTGLHNTDQIIKTVHAKDCVELTFVGGDVLQNEQAEYILKMICYDSGYLPLSCLKNYLMYRLVYSPYLETLADEAVLKEEFSELVASEMTRFQKYQNDPIVYAVNGKVFYADRTLTDQEIQHLHTVKGDQVQYDLDHNADGSFYCW